MIELVHACELRSLAQVSGCPGSMSASLIFASLSVLNCADGLLETLYSGQGAVEENSSASNEECSSISRILDSGLILENGGFSIAAQLIAKSGV